MFLTDNNLVPDSIEFLREQIAGEALKKAAPQLLEALQKAKEFIENGIEFGYIRMPDMDTPDAAHRMLPMINAAIAAAKGE